MSASHTVAFLRCLEAGLSNPDGQALEIAKADPIWDLIQNGWPWVVVHAEMEQAVPTLASFIQLAANSSNSIGKPINEVEVGLQLANHFTKGMTLDQAIQFVKAGDVRCRGSISHIATYVQRFAGGPSFPLLYFVSRFSSQMGATLLLGSQIMATIVSLDFKDPNSIYPFLRTAIWVTMLASGSSRDGFATMLTKGDLEKLKSPSIFAQVAKAESILCDAYQFFHTMQGSHEQESRFIKCLGRLNVRTILFLTQKQKQSRENKTWDSLADILQAFSDELHPSESATASSSSQSMIVCNAISASPKTLAMLQNIHMKLGNLYLRFKLNLKLLHEMHTIIETCRNSP